jgi:hypothetical protein
MHNLPLFRRDSDGHEAYLSTRYPFDANALKVTFCKRADYCAGRCVAVPTVHDCPIHPQTTTGVCRYADPHYRLQDDRELGQYYILRHDQATPYERDVRPFVWPICSSFENGWRGVCCEPRSQGWMITLPVVHQPPVPVYQRPL